MWLVLALYAIHIVRSCFAWVINPGHSSHLGKQSRVVLSQSVVYKRQIVVSDCKLNPGAPGFQPCLGVCPSLMLQISIMDPSSWRKGRLHIPTECLVVNRFTISYLFSVPHFPAVPYCEGGFLTQMLHGCSPQLLTDFSLGGISSFRW